MNPSFVSSQAPPNSSSSTLWKVEKYKQTSPALTIPNLQNYASSSINPAVSHRSSCAENSQEKGDESFQRQNSPDYANKDAEDLTGPVNDVEKLILEHGVHVQWREMGQTETNLTLSGHSAAGENALDHTDGKLTLAALMGDTIEPFLSPADGREALLTADILPTRPLPARCQATCTFRHRWRHTLSFPPNERETLSSLHFLHVPFSLLFLLQSYIFLFR